VPRRKPPTDELVLDDPRALRALAHPARTAVVDELYQGNVRTASELASLTGLTASAMSYHLRALEKWGIVRRATSSGDGRERPWEASAKGLTIMSAGASEAASDAVAGLYLDRLRHDLAAWRHHEPDEPDDDWRRLATVNRGYPRLTAEEAHELSQVVHDTLERLTVGRDNTERRPGSRKVAYFFAVVPVHPDDEIDD
jgi:DNA-binding transcriptional ArsR family regulator